MNVFSLMRIKTRSYEHPYLIENPGRREDKAGYQSNFDITDHACGRAEYLETTFRGCPIDRRTQGGVIWVVKQRHKSLCTKFLNKFLSLRLDALCVWVGGEFLANIVNKISYKVYCPLFCLRLVVRCLKYFDIWSFDEFDNPGTERQAYYRSYKQTCNGKNQAGAQFFQMVAQAHGGIERI